VTGEETLEGEAAARNVAEVLTILANAHTGSEWSK
jgi:hypothetical protein